MRILLGVLAMCMQGAAYDTVVGDDTPPPTPPPVTAAPTPQQSATPCTPGLARLQSECSAPAAVCDTTSGGNYVMSCQSPNCVDPDCSGINTRCFCGGGIMPTPAPPTPPQVINEGYGEAWHVLGWLFIAVVICAFVWWGYMIWKRREFYMPCCPPEFRRAV